MNKNNLNNKFGECCNCPALTTGKQYFTNYVSSRILNDDLRKNLKISDSHTYRYNLQANGTKYISNENNRYLNDRCKSDNKNNFYIDSSKYNFSSQLLNDYTAPSIQNNYIKKSQQSGL